MTLYSTMPQRVTEIITRDVLQRNRPGAWLSAALRTNTTESCLLVPKPIYIIRAELQIQTKSYMLCFNIEFNRPKRPAYIILPFLPIDR